MMQVMEPGAVIVNQPERIPGEDIAAVIADGLDGGESAEQHALPRRELRDFPGQHEGDDVEEDRFKPVAVDGAVGVGDVEAVVLRVD